MHQEACYQMYYKSKKKKMYSPALEIEKATTGQIHKEMLL